MKNLVIGTLCCVAASVAQADVIFYVNAHGDDAALFMGRSLSQHIKDSVAVGHRVVLITTTAGDAGFGSGPGKGVAPNYLAREQGHTNVLQFLWGRAGSNDAQYRSAMVKLGGKSIYRAQIAATQKAGDVTWYNLRLPDGNLGGEGYPHTGSESLLKLENGSISSISAIDGSARYSKDELLQLFQNIVKKEGKASKNIVINLVDQNGSNLNVGDHADHQATSRLFEQALNKHKLSCVGRAYYATYINNAKPINMNTHDLWLHIGMWGTLNQGLSAGGQFSTWEPEHNHWLGREYQTQSIQASNNCNF